MWCRRVPGDGDDGDAQHFALREIAGHVGVTTNSPVSILAGSSSVRIRERMERM